MRSHKFCQVHLSHFQLKIILIFLYIKIILLFRILKRSFLSLREDIKILKQHMLRETLIHLKERKFIYKK